VANTIEILVPTAEPKVTKNLINLRVHDLNRRVVGFLWNEKPNGDFLLQRIREHIVQKYKLVLTEWVQVEGLHIGLEEAPEVKKLATSAEAVVIAVAD
jgi:hypothetical protein